MSMFFGLCVLMSYVSVNSFSLYSFRMLLILAVVQEEGFTSLSGCISMLWTTRGKITLQQELNPRTPNQKPHFY